MISNITCYTSSTFRLLYSYNPNCGNCSFVSSFPSPAFLPKSTVKDHDDIGSRNFHPEGLAENNFRVFQILLETCLCFQILWGSCSPYNRQDSASIRQCALKVRAVWLHRQRFGRQPRACSLKASCGWCKSSSRTCSTTSSSSLTLQLCLPSLN